jgi:regulator of replication initiation timing
LRSERPTPVPTPHDEEREVKETINPLLIKSIDELKAENAGLKAENARLREVLAFGLDVMMPEIHAQRTLWPGEVDSFEDMAKKAMGR